MQDIQWFTAGGGGGGGTSFWTANGDDIYNNNSGNVGIGTAAPTAPLEVFAPSTGLSNIFKITKQGAPLSYFSVFSNTSNTSRFSPAFLGYNGADINQAVQFIGGIDSAWDIAGNPILTFQARRGGTSGAPVSTRDLFDWANYGTSVMRIKANGNVGIGTTSPSEKLSVIGRIALTDGNGSVAVGNDANTQTTGQGNTAIGLGALHGGGGATFSRNTGIGYEALAVLQDGNGQPFGNVAIGYQAANLLTRGYGNIAIGERAQVGTTGDGTIAIGHAVVSTGVTIGFAANGTGGLAIGRVAVASATDSHAVGTGTQATSNENQAFGNGCIATGAASIAYGYRCTASGGRTIAIGNQITASGNDSIGIGSITNITGIYAVGVGRLTRANNDCISIGYETGRHTTGVNNILIGTQAGRGVAGSSTFANSIGIGKNALIGLTTGGFNIAIGTESGLKITSGNHNLGLGYQSNYEVQTGDNNTAVGWQSNRFVGSASSDNTGVGYLANSRSTGLSNTALGSRAAEGIIGGSSFNYVTAIGARALEELTTGSSNTALGYMAGSSLTEGSGNVLLGFMAGSNLTGERDLLYIANSDTNTPLIYGEFPNNLLRVNAPLNVFGETNVVGNTTIKGQFEVERSDSTTNLLTISSTSFDYRIANNNNNARVTIDRDGSTSSDVVALKVGSNITIKRNGGGTPAFSVGNAGFIYTQNYNGNTAGNTNVFNNGAGMGIRNTASGSKVILSLYINGVFGALNSAGATLQIGNPYAANSDWTSSHATHFRNANRFEIDGANTTASEEKRYIFRYNRIAVPSGTDDYRLGVQISGMANQQLGTSNNTQCTMTNGSNVVTLTTGTLRPWATEGTTIYFNASSGGTYQEISSSSVKYTITSILSTTSFTISGVWTGDDGIEVYAFLEPYSLTIRNWNKDVLARWKPDGQFQVGTTNISGGLDVTEAISYQITDVTHSAASEYLVGTTEFIVFNTWSGANGQAFVRLPLVANSEGRVLRFKSDGTINNSAYATITPNAADVGVTIDGLASFDLDRDYDGIMLLCHNSNWYVIQRKSK